VYGLQLGLGHNTCMPHFNHIYPPKCTEYKQAHTIVLPSDDHKQLTANHCCPQAAMQIMSQWC